MDDSLIEAAKRATDNAYAPYSKFKVGAAVRSSTGEIYAGCNVENASFPVGACAEKHAIAAGVLAEGRGFKIVAVAVYADHANCSPHAVSPCGACRQAIVEFSDKDAVIFFPDERGQFQQISAGELLPHSFSFPGNK